MAKDVVNNRDVKSVSLSDVNDKDILDYMYCTGEKFGSLAKRAIRALIAKEESLTGISYSQQADIKRRRLNGEVIVSATTNQSVVNIPTSPIILDNNVVNLNNHEVLTDLSNIVSEKKEEIVEYKASNTAKKRYLD